MVAEIRPYEVSIQKMWREETFKKAVAEKAQELHEEEEIWRPEDIDIMVTAGKGAKVLIWTRTDEASTRKVGTYRVQTGDKTKASVEFIERKI